MGYRAENKDSETGTWRLCVCETARSRPMVQPTRDECGILVDQSSTQTSKMLRGCTKANGVQGDIDDTGPASSFRLLYLYLL